LQIYLILKALITFYLEQLINKLKHRLQSPLPGQDAQYLMAPVNRERIALEILKVENYRPSAVMILFCTDEQGEPFIPLIERMAYKGFHSAQISLPGGKFEAADSNLQQTATRECFEEIGIKDIEVLGSLTQLYIPVSGFLVQPFVGVCTVKNPAMISQQREVKTILKLGIDTLMQDSSVKSGSIETAEQLAIKTNYFEVESYKVWGATAMILSELKEVMRSIS
jgi:hypothetical protein